MYAFWQAFLSLFLRRRVVITLSNGQRIVHTRPKGTTVEGYRKEIDAWRRAANHRIEFTDWVRTSTISSSNIISVTVR